MKYQANNLLHPAIGYNRLLVACLAVAGLVAAALAASTDVAQAQVQTPDAPTVINIRENQTQLVASWRLENEPVSSNLLNLSNGKKVAEVPVTELQVRHKLSSATAWTTGDEDSFIAGGLVSVGYPIDGLTNGSQYDVQMRLGNMTGSGGTKEWGAWSATFTGTPNKKPYPGPVRELDVSLDSTSNPTEVEITFKQSDLTKYTAATNYRVVLKWDYVDWFEPIINQTTVRHHTVSYRSGSEREYTVNFGKSSGCPTFADSDEDGTIDDVYPHDGVPDNQIWPDRGYSSTSGLCMLPRTNYKVTVFAYNTAYGSGSAEVVAVARKDNYYVPCGTGGWTCITTPEYTLMVAEFLGVAG